MNITLQGMSTKEGSSRSKRLIAGRLPPLPAKHDGGIEP